MKKFNKSKVFGVVALCACAAITPALAACSNDGLVEDPGAYKGVTDTTIYVGNTAGTTGALASIGAPFNYGIQAAFWEYNEKGGFSGTYNGKEVSGLNVALKTYDDGGIGTNTVTYTERLIHEDEVFAIVGNFGSYAVTANLDIIKEAGVPMVYAAAGNEELSDAAASGIDRYAFPVQPISSTEGAFLIQRAFAATEKGGLAGTKVGVISNNNDASVALVNAIKKEANNLTAEQKNNINYQNVSDTETGYATAAAALKNAGCDVVILALATDYIKSVVALVDAGFTSENVKTLTAYANSSTALFDDPSTKLFNPAYTDIINGVYAQGWIDITSTTYVYKKEGALWDSYKALVAGSAYEGLHDNGVAGFCEEYWKVADVLFDYGVANLSAVPTGYLPFTLSYDAYALAGYIAGDLFCQGLEALGERELTRNNYVEAMESKVFDLALADTISFADGKRLGVEAFSLNQFSAPYGQFAATSSTVVHSLSTIDEFKKA